MTDKELAEEYEEKAEYIEINDDGKRRYDSIDIQEAFLAGLEIGRPQWHRMDYKDKESFKNIPRYIELLTMYDCGLFVAHCVNKWTGDKWCDHTYGVIAWCEIPTFKE